MYYERLLDKINEQMPEMKERLCFMILDSMDNTLIYCSANTDEVDKLIEIDKLVYHLLYKLNDNLIKSLNELIMNRPRTDATATVIEKILESTDSYITNDGIKLIIRYVSLLYNRFPQDELVCSVYNMCVNDADNNIKPYTEQTPTV